MTEEMHQQYTIGEFSKLTGIHIKTLQKYDRNGKLKAYRTPTGRRYYTKFQLNRLLGEPSDATPVVIYTRAYGSAANFYNHQQAVEIATYCDTKDYIITNIYSDNALAFDYGRPGLNRMLKDAKEKIFNHLIIVDMSALSFFDSQDLLPYLNDELGIEVTILHRRMNRNPYFLIEEIQYAIQHYTDLGDINASRLMSEIEQIKMDLLAQLKTKDPDTFNNFKDMFFNKKALPFNHFQTMDRDEFAAAVLKETGKTHFVDFNLDDANEHAPKFAITPQVSLPEIEPFTY